MPELVTEPIREGELAIDAVRRNLKARGCRCDAQVTIQARGGDKMHADVVHEERCPMVVLAKALGKL